MEAAEAALAEFAASPWGENCPKIAPGWQPAWAQVVPLFACPLAVRRMIYTTNAIESLHGQLSKIIKACGHFPTDDAVLKLLWPALPNALAPRIRSAKEWIEAIKLYAILYGERFTPVAV